MTTPSEIEGEIEAATRTAGLFDVSRDGKIAVAGKDRESFLQGLLTSDVASLAEGFAQRSAIVTAMGRLVADLVALKRPGEVLLQTAPDRREAALATLGRYLVADDVELADGSDEWAILSVQGPLAAHVVGSACPGLAAPPERPFAVREVEAPEGRLLVVRHDRFGSPGLDLWAPAPAAAALRERVLGCGAEHGLVACGEAASEALRIAAGRAAWGREIDDRAFPFEVGLSSAVSLTKGCYMGQEVLSRIHFQGHVNRVLARVTLDRMPASPLPLPLARGAEDAGQLTSAARVPGTPSAVGLAMLRRAVAAAGARYAARAGGGAPIQVAVIDLVE